MPAVAHRRVGGCIQVAIGCAFKSSVCRDVDSELCVGHEQSFVLLRGEQGAACWLLPSCGHKCCKGYRVLLASTLTLQMRWQPRHTRVLD